MWNNAKCVANFLLKQGNVAPPSTQHNIVWIKLQRIFFLFHVFYFQLLSDLEYAIKMFVKDSFFQNIKCLKWECENELHQG